MLSHFPSLPYLSTQDMPRLSEEDEGVVILTHSALLSRASPRIPRALPARYLDGLPLCEAPLRALLHCVQKFESEVFCQHPMMVFMNCKEQRVSVVS